MSRRRAGSAVQERRRTLRCAIYTRKSSEEGLEQSFNSLDAQRDACEAFIASQKHEGWVALPDKYDDGGFSGGSMDRPALQRLLEGVSNGSIDVIVVYKVDRLSRSLSDFARLTDRFDKHGTSFVSVTQQFNTSTSMGRLTLNVLLSFAQFEREVAGERIRDKIALSKRRGMWMGGLPPLGYDGIDRKLVVNEAEAETVRLIFRWYLEARSVAELKRRLEGEGTVSKRRTFEDGRTAGGVPFSRGAIYQILRNRLYRGEIAHLGEVHKGNHDPIVDKDQWDAVQAKLAVQSQRARGSTSQPTSGALLAGILFDDAGNRMTPTYSAKGKRRYHYYVSAPMVRGGKGEGIRIPALDLEALVRTAVADRVRDLAWLERLAGEDAAQDARTSVALRDAGAVLAGAVSMGGEAVGNGGGRGHETHNGHERAAHPSNDDRISGLRRLIDCTIVSRDKVAITLDRAAVVDALIESGARIQSESASENDAPPLTIDVPAWPLRCGKQVRLIVGDVSSERRSPDPKLIRLIADAHRWFEDLRAGRAATIAEIATRDGQQVSHVSRTLPLAFLAPGIVEMILDGQPPTPAIERLKERRRSLPIDWRKQQALLLLR